MLMLRIGHDQGQRLEEAIANQERQAFAEGSVRRMVLVVALLESLSACRGKTHEVRLSWVEDKKMSEEHIFWTAEAVTYPGEREYLFMFDPVMGLLDIDMHRITDDGWKYLSAPDVETTAYLAVPPFTTLKEIEGALLLLKTKGGFKRVRIAVRTP